jgi:hypothetical protein
LHAKTVNRRTKKFRKNNNMRVRQQSKDFMPGFLLHSSNFPYVCANSGPRHVFISISPDIIELHIDKIDFSEQYAIPRWLIQQQ